MGMSLDEVPQHGETPFQYGGGTSDDAAVAAVNNESTTSDGDTTFEEYIVRTVPGLAGDVSATYRDTQPLLDPDNPDSENVY